MNGGILYKSKYGSTGQYAQWLSHDLHLPILEIDNVSEESIKLHDFFLIGSPVYIGKLSVAKWLKKHETMLKEKKVFLFIVCGTSLKNEEQLKQILHENLTEQLEKSCIVFFLPGRLVKTKLSWLDRLLLKVGARFEKDPVVRSHMLTDFDAVVKSNLIEIEESVRHFLSNPGSPLTLH